MPFVKNRIYLAIEAAIKAVHKIEILESALAQKVSEITEKVISQIFNKQISSITVEEIQDIVEITLVKCDMQEIAKSYMIYRNHRANVRDQKNKKIKVYRQMGKTPVVFNPIKIAHTVEEIFKQVNSTNYNPLDKQTLETINRLTQKIIDKVLRDQPIDLDLIEDILEETLMMEGYFAEAKYYILYRKEKQDKEKVELDTSKFPIGKTKDLKPIGNTTKKDILARLQFACKGYKTVSIEDLFNNGVNNFHSQMEESEIDNVLIMSARSYCEVHPDYSFVGARLLLDKIYKEILQVSALDPHLKKAHKEYFVKYVKQLVYKEQLAQEMMSFDLVKLSKHLDLSRDKLFQVLGLQTLYDRYFLKHLQSSKPLETPQIFWMRVAMGLALKEKNKTERAIEFYDLLSNMMYCSSTPTLFNSGTTKPQMSSCYISTVKDNLSHIFKSIGDNAQLSKWSGGLGNDWTNVRALGSYIKGTNGQSKGVIPFLKIANDTSIAVNQGGKRKGSLCSYLETWHLDIEEFLELRKNTGDDRRRTHDMNTANWIPDLFIKRVLANQDWTLFSPDVTPDLHSLYGEKFEKRYVEYEQMAIKGKIEQFKRIKAVSLWKKMLGMLFETGHPWIIFKDPANIRSTQDHVGVINSSNLCTEIFLNSSEDEVAVCNLGSVNLVKHVKDGVIDKKQLAKTIKSAIRMLDNVIDINFYPIKEAKNSNISHRPIGLGIAGFQDLLYKMKVSYASHEAIEISDTLMEFISYEAILASINLAKERGVYTSFKGSKWDRGLLPIDTISLLGKERGVNVKMDCTTRLDWDYVRKELKKHGIRNSNTMSIAPTATLSNICGVSASIEPTYRHLYTKSNLSGDFTKINSYLVEALEKLNLWNQDMLEELKYYDGSIVEIEKIPEEIKRVFPTCFEIDPQWLIECASRRQKWLDMGQSLNLYIEHASGKHLHKMYIQAWEKGLKSTYYLRSLGKTQIEKSTSDINKKGIQPRWMKNKSSSDRIKIDRCSIEECESCT